VSRWVAAVTELVSILIPAYNAAEWLPQTVRSALAQTWPRTEVIIVDDGSSDRTLEVGKAFESRTVKVVTQQNAGAVAARNAALRLAQGDYIQWLDADDLLDPAKISAQMRVAHEASDPHVLLAGAFGTFFYRPEKASFAPNALWRDLEPVEYFLMRFNHNAYFQTDAWLVSRALTDAAGPWTDVDSPDDDGEYFCRIVMRSRGVKFVSDARSYYRIANLNGVSQVRSPRAQTALFESKVKCIRYLLSLEDSARTREASVRLMQDWLRHFYASRKDLVDKAQQLATELGGQLHRPSVRWKYKPIAWVLGYEAAVSASHFLPRFRTRLRCWQDERQYRASRTATEFNQ
jgi:glycosyltransferase involved in cell wall biosynthesis